MNGNAIRESSPMTESTSSAHWMRSCHSIGKNWHVIRHPINNDMSTLSTGTIGRGH